jgi:hypothetical protein
MQRKKPWKWRYETNKGVVNPRNWLDGALWLKIVESTEGFANLPVLLASPVNIERFRMSRSPSPPLSPDSSDGGRIPDLNDDHIQTLYDHYFLAADLMRDQYERLQAKDAQNGRLSQREARNSAIYFLTWLVYLAAVSEGFDKIRPLPRPPEYDELRETVNSLRSHLSKHKSALRELRNSVVHLRDGTNAVRAFLGDGADLIGWARELHDRFRRYFSAYRVLSETLYLLSGRLDQSLIRREAQGKRKSSAGKSE